MSIDGLEKRLESAHSGIQVAPFLLLVAFHGEVVLAPELRVPVCDDLRTTSSSRAR